METITLTFGDCGENHVGMQKIGSEAERGFSKRKLKKIQRLCEYLGKTCEFYKLHKNLEVRNQKAYILIVRDFVDNKKEIFEEQKKLKWDTKVFMYGSVKNKLARYNLCYDENHKTQILKIRKELSLRGIVFLIQKV